MHRPRPGQRRVEPVQAGPLEAERHDHHHQQQPQSSAPRRPRRCGRRGARRAPPSPRRRRWRWRRTASPGRARRGRGWRGAGRRRRPQPRASAQAMPATTAPQWRPTSRDHLGREVEAEGGADQQLPGVAQRRRRVQRQAGEAGDGGGHQRPDQPGQRRAGGGEEQRGRRAEDERGGGVAQARSRGHEEWTRRGQGGGAGSGVRKVAMRPAVHGRPPAGPGAHGRVGVDCTAAAAAVAPAPQAAQGRGAGVASSLSRRGSPSLARRRSRRVSRSGDAAGGGRPAGRVSHARLRRSVSAHPENCRVNMCQSPDGGVRRLFHVAGIVSDAGRIDA